jgi:S-(hydroxymethyl)glutathione dehydrogenase/alcohol dehydrogenase
MTVETTRRIRAAVLWEAHRPLEVREAELDAPHEGEVEVRVAAAGVCGSDIHQLLGEYRLPLPCVPGHEGAGVVTRVGPGVQHVRPGDHVVLLWRSACGRCRPCLDGRPALCERAVAIRRDGVMADGQSRIRVEGRPVHHFIGVSCWADHAVLPASGVVPIPAEVPLELAALVGCAVVTGVGAAWNAAALRPWQSVAVFGCGGVGLNVIQGAALAGAHPIVAVDARPEKADLARTFGATAFVAGRGAEAVPRVRELTGGGADVAFEVVGIPALQEAAVAATRAGGTTVLVGVAPSGASLRLDPELLVQQDRTLRGSIYGSGRPDRDIPRLLALFAAGRLKLGELLSRRYALDEVNEAVAAMRAGDLARVLIDPWG